MRVRVKCEGWQDGQVTVTVRADPLVVSCEATQGGISDQILFVNRLDLYHKSPNSGERR